ncbi:uncharacterized transposon-derived protein F52C9.6 [Trichonephila clavipes]|nr:uncharacterized transposon-derived protein F52C9.6 [Trichonephila clavipes]
MYKSRSLPHGSLVVKVTDSWSACHGLEPSTAKDPPCRGAMHVKYVETQTSSRWIQVNGSWRRRSNLELYKIYKQPDIVKFAKLPRLLWTGHLARMNEDHCCKKIFLAKPMANRPRDRPMLRWIDCVKKDLNILKVENRKTVVKSRDVWKKFLEKARAYPRLSSH